MAAAASAMIRTPHQASDFRWNVQPAQIVVLTLHEHSLIRARLAASSIESEWQ
jgi:hypothetical protein